MAGKTRGRDDRSDAVDAFEDAVEMTAPSAKDQQDLRHDRGRDPGVAERKRPGDDVPDAPRDLPPQEPPD